MLAPTVHGIRTTPDNSRACGWWHGAAHQGGQVGGKTERGQQMTSPTAKAADRRRLIPLGPPTGQAEARQRLLRVTTGSPRPPPRRPAGSAEADLSGPSGSEFQFNQGALQNRFRLGQDSITNGHAGRHVADRDNHRRRSRREPPPKESPTWTYRSEITRIPRLSTAATRIGIRIKE
jgi:hypothetical protein